VENATLLVAPVARQGEQRQSVNKTLSAVDSVEIEHNMLDLINNE
jgi:hypothetical protein